LRKSAIVDFSSVYVVIAISMSYNHALAIYFLLCGIQLKGATL